MIPSASGFLKHDFEVKEQPSRVYKMDLQGTSVRGFCDEMAAMKQMVYRILNTERYKYIIYSWNYGIEIIDLYGKPITYVCPELERRIREALIVDTRVTDVSDFQHDTTQKGIVHTKFVVHTIFGDIEADKRVNI